jgi:type II secretory ATPase GspE/PulE/Tfp pilus assembly ATPase PilB-like protein
MASRTPFPLLRRLLVVGLVFAGAVPALWAADASFPRGTGFYFSLPKLVTLVLMLWAWVKLFGWLDRDANQSGMDSNRWNLLLLGVSLVGFLVVWVLSWFWCASFLLWLMILATVIVYAQFRNQQVAEGQRLFTRQHLIRVAHGLVPSLSAKVEQIAQPPRNPVRFISRRITGGEADDPDRAGRVQESKGHKAAQEMVWEALQQRATDVHLEPSDEYVLVRFRVDGVMNNATPFSRAMGEAVINIFKVLANLDITERRKPQDGSFSAQVGQAIGPGEWQYRLVDFRIATAGSVAGEKLVMRILDAAQQLTELSQVGMTDTMRTQVTDLITRPHGLFLVCGPTGSGKSTTLYACLHTIDRFGQNVITIENPVEHRLDHVTQIEINPKAGKTFASELRSVLRQDPDVIMVGEIRDKETAEIACQAAQTGHLVFSTVHANDAVTAIARLIDLGVQPFMVATALIAVLGQRLVRRLCPVCRVRYRPTAEALRKLGVDADFVRVLYRPPDPDDRKPPRPGEEEAVCEECGGTGYLKRTGIFELLVMNESIRALIRDNPDFQKIRMEAIRAGLRGLFDDGARLVIEGESSIQELLRVMK